jgi:hypothetical protein
MEAIDRTSLLERRSKVRYPITMYLRYHSIDRNKTTHGLGRLVNMSTGSILVASERHVPVGKRLEVNINWPLLLDGVVPLQLVADGKVVRSDESSFALKLTHCEFRTMRRDIHSAPEEHGIPLTRPLALVRSASA